MASTISITCPECDKQLKASSDLLGKKIRCKGCGATFAARAPGGKSDPDEEEARPKGKPGAKKAAAKPKPSAVSDDEDNNPYGMTEEYLGRRCPDCAEALDDEQVICLNCGYNTLTRERARTRKVRDITGMDIFLHLLPGILCALGVLGLIGFDLWFIFQITPESFGDVWYDFIGSKALKIWISIIVLFIVSLLSRFAVRRLVFHYMPAEVEEKMEHKPK